MKTAFALAFLAAGAQATIGAVTGEWKTTNHLTDSTLQICASHSVATVSGAANTITYTYAGATCTAASTTATVAAELTWGKGAAKSNAEASGAQAATTTCKINDTTKTVECNTIAVATTEFSCVQLLKCRPTTQSNAAGTFKVKQSTTDTVDVVSLAATAFAPTALAVLTVTKPATDNAKVGAAEFDFTLAIDPAVDIAVGKVVSVLAPGYTQAIGGACKFGTGTASTVTTAAAADKWSFTVAGASGAAATTLVCTKVKVSATAKMAASNFAVIWGDFATTTTEAKWVASPAIAAAPTSSASTVSLSAAAVLLAASLYL